MGLLLSHQNVTYEDATVHLRGNAYVGCKFIRCNLVVRDGAFMLKGCQFSSCAWHLDMVLASKGEFEAMAELMRIIEQSVVADGVDEADVTAG